jgi:dolichol-phosphate mannosyltransferase
VPTYNERGNVETLYRQLREVGLDTDILFVDDNSPDGTGQLLDELAKQDPRLFIVHRPGKQGIGTAHQAGIAWAYQHGYERLISMDCDFTHSPSDIPRLLEHAEQYAVVVGSRHMRPDSLPGWNLVRRALTHFGHFLTRYLLGIPQDATGAFRVYDLTKISAYFFTQVISRGYSFFFESMFLLVRNGYTIHEVPIMLPARTYGHSKMSYFEAARSGLRVLKLWLLVLFNPGRFVVNEPFTDVNPALVDPQGWDAYWLKKDKASNFIYAIIAWVYRNLVIKRLVTYTLRKHFANESRLLHEGCGSGQVDAAVQRHMSITALDISVPALSLYKKHNPRAERIIHGSIFELPMADASFDGVYSVGVIEHFTPQEIVSIFIESRRVVKPGGKIVLFWPHNRGTSVAVLRFAHWVLNSVLHRNVQLHPPEPSVFRSRAVLEPLAAQAGLKVIEVSFGPRDFWVQTRVVLERPISP